MVNLNPQLLQAKAISPDDVLTALENQNLILPGGTAKIGQFEYDVDLNADLKSVQGFNNLPIKKVGDAIVYLRDVATVSDGFAPQTNVVRQDGSRGVLVTVLKAGDASTIDVVKGIRQLLPRVEQTLPPQLKIRPVSDQSIFVRGSINGVIREAVIAAALSGRHLPETYGNWKQLDDCRTFDTCRRFHAIVLGVCQQQRPAPCVAWFYSPLSLTLKISIRTLEASSSGSRDDSASGAECAQMRHPGSI